MADANFTLTSNTWWSTNPAAAGDGSSFAQRKAIPTGVGTGILNMVVNADVNFTLVLEVQSGAIVLGNDAVAAKTFTCYGGLYTVDSTNTAIHPGNTCAFRCAIGGTTGYKEGLKTLTSFVQVANIDWGQDSAGNPTGNVAQHMGCRSTISQYYYNCTVKQFYNEASGGVSSISKNIVWESSTFYGGNSGATACIGGIVGILAITLIACAQITTGTYWLYLGGYYSSTSVDIVGGLTKGGDGGGSIYLQQTSSGALTATFYRRAYNKITTDGTTALSGAAFSAYEATGGVEMPLSSGVTGATGLCKPQSPTIYNDSLWALQKVETYIRTTAGAMTWGTPTSTVTYGNYTHTFSKSGYVTQTQTHDFTDGADWGTVGTPIAITMAVPTTYFQGAGGLWGTISYPNPWDNIKKVTCYASTLTIYDFLINASLPFTVPTGGLTVYLYNEAGELVSTPYTSTGPVSLTGGSTYDSLTTLTGLKSFTSPATPGKYRLACEVYDPARTSDYMWEQVWIEVLPTAPTITSPAISAASIAQDSRATITFTTTGTRAWVTFIGADGAVEYSKDAAITGGAATCTIPGRCLTVGTYAAGQIELHAVDSTGALADLDETLALTVTASSSSYQMQAALALQDVLQADSRLAAIEDDDIIVATHEAVVDQLHNYPAIIIIPDSDTPAYHTVNLRRHRCQLWVLVAVQHQMARLDFMDITEPDLAHDWVKAIVDMCEEECEDPDLRLGGLVQSIHAAKSSPKVVPGKALYVAFIQVDTEILGK